MLITEIGEDIPRLYDKVRRCEKEGKKESCG